MPTPSPMSEPRMGANVAILSPWLSSAVVAVAIPRAKSATPSGRSIAKNEPNASTSTIAVAIRPKSSPGLPFCAASCSKALPANCTLSEEERAVMPAFSTGWICLDFSL